MVPTALYFYCGTNKMPRSVENTLGTTKYSLVLFVLHEVFFCFEVIVQTRVSVLPLISKYRQAGWKYEAHPGVLTSLSVFRF